MNIAQGDLFKPLEITLTLNGVAFALVETEGEVEGDEITLRWTDKEGTVTEVEPTIVDATAGEIEHVFEAGQTDVIGPCAGQVTVTRAGKPLSFPDDGSFFAWTVTRKI